MAGRSPRVALFGVPGDNLNLGVKALMHSAVAGLHARLPGLEPWVFDDGLGTGPAELPLDSGPLAYVRCGARLSRRVHRPESFANMRVAGALRFAGGAVPNPAVDALVDSDAVLDASAGDSFTDIYGAKRLRMILAPKRLALQLRRPLVLLPQTFGPFREEASRQAAAKVVRRATMAWARDEESHRLLVELAGPDHDPERHRLGVDMAFLLERHRPPERLAERLDGWFRDRRGPVVGINLSGLLYGDREAYGSFGLSFDYRTVMQRLVGRLLEETDARIVFVDHVGGDLEPDARATAQVVAQVDPALRDRVMAVPAGSDPCQAKWVISQVDWFCGARMHSTIAALSSGVPAAAVGYSRKARGVFETCGIAGEVTEVTGLDEDGVAGQLWGSWERRDRVRATLAEHLPAVLATAGHQMDEIATLVRGSYLLRRQPA